MEIRRPTDTLDLLIGLADWWERSQYREAFATNFQTQGVTFPVKLDQYLTNRFRHASPVYVRAHVVSKLWGFARRYETDQPLTADDLPFDRGFVYLETPVYITDIRGRIMIIHGFLWCREEGGVAIFDLGWRNHPDDELTHEIHATFGKDWQVEPVMPLLHWQTWKFGWSVAAIADASTFDSRATAPRSLPGTPQPTERSRKWATEDAALANMFLLSLWDYMHDQLPSRLCPDRPLKRRLERAGWRVSEVKVVELRASAQHHDRSEFPQKVDWSYRWWVREHRRRWIDKRTGELRETTVRAHVRGPEDKPIVLKDTVYDVKR